MLPSRLSAVQARVLTVLSTGRGEWVLTGGAALVGFHTRHRVTRDLDLSWRSRVEIGDARDHVIDLLTGAGMQLEVLQTSPAFLRLPVTDDNETVVVDLVAEPVAAIEPPMQVAFGAVTIRLDSPHEILVNKLCTLVQRSELRDLIDVAALLEHGGDLNRALRDAPRKDAGFSPLTLIWLLREMPVLALSLASGESNALSRDRVEFRDRLIALVAAAAHNG